MRAGELGGGGGPRPAPGLLVALPHANLGAALLEAGEPERARAQLAEARERGALEHWVGRCWWELWMCEAELALGRWTRRRLGAARHRDRGARWGCPGAARGTPGRRAAVRWRAATRARPPGHAGRGATTLAGAGRRVDGERARILAGRALAAAGRREPGDRGARAGRGRAVEAGAPRLADGAARELRKLGLRVRAPGARAARPPASDP